MLPWLFFISIGVLVGVAIYVGYYLKKKRRQELALAAKQLGLEFSLVDTLGGIGYPFALFQKGDGRGCENVMWGTWQGLPLREFDYWYYVKSKDRKCANDLIDSRMMQWLQQAGEDWAYEVIGSQMLCFSKRRKPVEL